MNVRIRRVFALPVLLAGLGVVLPAAARTPEPAGRGAGMVSGGADVLDEEKLTRLSSFLATTFGRAPESIAARLRHLRSAPGAGLYVEVQQNGPARPAVVLEPAGGAKASLLVNGEIAVDLPTRGPAVEDALAVFWVHAGTQERYRVRVPPSVRHVTLVVNGREVVSARPLDPRAGPVSLRP